MPTAHANEHTHSAKRSVLIGACAGLAHALCLYLASPLVGLWPCALLAVMPLMLAADGASRGRWLALGAFFGVSPWMAMQQWWVKDVTAAGVGPFIALQSMYPAIFAAVWRSIRRRGRTAHAWGCAVWVGIECARGEVILGGYAWGLVGHPLIDMPTGPSIVALGGAYLLSAWAVCVSGFVIDVFSRSRSMRFITGVGVLLVSVPVAGVLTSPFAQPSRSLAVGVVQTNVPQSNKTHWTLQREVEDYRRFQQLTLDLANASEGKLDVVVWPETMMPGATLEPEALHALREADLGYVLDEPVRVDDRTFDIAPATLFADLVMELQQRISVPMLLGEEGLTGLRVVREERGVRVEHDKRFNSVYLVRDGQPQRQRYDKVVLTPFGEYMPVISRWTWLEKQVLALGAKGMSFDLDAGTDRTVFSIETRAGTDPVRIATPICFEVVSSSHCRWLVFDGSSRRSDVLINLTNDGWFGTSRLAREEHLLAARVRCAENATPMVRAANTGISAMIDARGRVMEKLAGGVFNIDGVAAWNLPIGEGRSIFAMIGNVFGWCMLALGIVVLWRSRKGDPQPGRFMEGPNTGR